ncbi:MAG TPA: glycosyltransferase family 4 protein [Dehalococcoidia bacterium]
MYAERLAQALLARGHSVTVLTSHFDKGLAREEIVDGVRVVRVPVAFHVSKGVIMPAFGFYATRLVKEHDVLSVHLPQFDAWGLALRGRLFKKPCVLTYHCDLELPEGAVNRVIDQATFAANYAAAVMSDRIVAYTQDYADHSRLLRRFKKKIKVILPPVVMPAPAAVDVEAFAAKHGLAGRKPVLGFVARFATEKGIEVLIDAVPELRKRYPEFKVLFAGPYKDIMGEEGYRARLFPLIEAMGDHWEFLGSLQPSELPAFYASLDALLVPSLNMTESFGLVQLEAMLCGTPVIASNLPGVRQPIRMTGMGEVIPIGDSPAMAEAVTRLVENKASYVRPRDEIESLFGLEQTVEAYERLFEAEVEAKPHSAARAKVGTSA